MRWEPNCRTVLELDNCSSITDAALDSIKALRNLERVDLFDCANITKDAIKRFKVSLIDALFIALALSEFMLSMLKQFRPDVEVHAYFGEIITNELGGVFYKNHPVQHPLHPHPSSNHRGTGYAGVARSSDHGPTCTHMKHSYIQFRQTCIRIHSAFSSRPTLTNFCACDSCS